MKYESIMRYCSSYIFYVIILVLRDRIKLGEAVVIQNCSSDLQIGDYLCNLTDIDRDTQQLRGCNENNTAKVTCIASKNITCSEFNNTIFYKEVPCKWTNKYNFDTALLLSIFLGMFGVDRFYLGYPAIGLLKFCTLGFMFLGQLVDIILIATQVVGPADGSHYVISYYGPGIEVIGMNNITYKLPQEEWRIQDL